MLVYCGKVKDFVKYTKDGIICDTLINMRRRKFQNKISCEKKWKK